MRKRLPFHYRVKVQCTAGMLMALLTSHSVTATTAAIEGPVPDLYQQVQNISVSGKVQDGVATFNGRQI